MELVWVRTKPGRLAFTKPVGGIAIPNDRFVLVYRSKWIDELIVKHHDIGDWDGVGTAPDASVTDFPINPAIGSTWPHPVTGLSYRYTTDGVTSFWIRETSSTFPPNPSLGTTKVVGLTTFVCTDEYPPVWAEQSTEVITAAAVGPELTAIAAIPRAKGTIIAGAATGWVPLPVGSPGQMLTPDTSTATGLAWVPAASAEFMGWSPAP